MLPLSEKKQLVRNRRQLYSRRNISESSCVTRAICRHHLCSSKRGCNSGKTDAGTQLEDTAASLQCDQGLQTCQLPDDVHAKIEGQGSEHPRSHGFMFQPAHHQVARLPQHQGYLAHCSDNILSHVNAASSPWHVLWLINLPFPLKGARYLTTCTNQTGTNGTGGTFNKLGWLHPGQVSGCGLRRKFMSAQSRLDTHHFYMSWPLSL